MMFGPQRGFLRAACPCGMRQYRRQDQVASSREVMEDVAVFETDAALDNVEIITS